MTMPSDSALQVFYGTLPVVAAILLANWNNNKRLDDLNKRIEDLNKRIEDLNKRIDDLKTSLNTRIGDLATQMTTGIADVKASLVKLDTRVSELEKGLRIVR
jgi:predicted  nucleic acid-binding Zn-ribbon protein